MALAATPGTRGTLLGCPDVLALLAAARRLRGLPGPLAAALGRRIVVHGAGGVLWEGGAGPVLEVLLHARHYYAVVPAG